MKHLYFFWLTISLFSMSTLNGQSKLNIQPRFSNSYRFTATDVWNIDLQYSGVKSIRATITVTIADFKNRQVAELLSEPITLTPGVQVYSPSTLNSQQLRYFLAGISDFEAATGSFPAGQYKICYRPNCITQDCDGEGVGALYSENPNCFEVTVEPPTPLLLAFPEDKSEIETARPTFQWIPPMPISNIAGFNYMLTLVAARKNQTCPDAITRNRPLYQQARIDLPVLPFPPEMNDLDTGIKYCWKVDGLLSDIPVAKSEVWEFKLKVPKKDTSYQTYYVIGNENLKTFEIAEKLGIIYFEKKPRAVLQYEIIEQSSGTVAIAGQLESKYGENKYVINIKDFSNIKPKTVYQLVIKDASGITKMFRFLKAQ